MPRAVASALTAGEYVIGRGDVWTPRAGLAVLSEIDRARLSTVIAEAQFAMDCDEEWLANRLTVLWLAAGYRKGEAQATAWLGETVRLLAHVPTDIVSSAIDQAVMGSDRGFLPSVGEILKLAEPGLEKRRLALRRMQAMARKMEALEDEPAPTPSVCTPSEAAEILREAGLPSAKPAEADDAQSPTEPGIADYLALGLTEAEAEEALAERRRMLSRGHRQSFANAASAALKGMAA